MGQAEGEEQQAELHEKCLREVAEALQTALADVRRVLLRTECPAVVAKAITHLSSMAHLVTKETFGSLCGFLVETMARAGVSEDALLAILTKDLCPDNEAVRE